MTVLRIPANHAGGLLDDLDSDTVSGDGIRMQARWRHKATVVTISGDVDALTCDRMHAFATRFILDGNTLILDTSGVDFLSARGVSVLIAVDDACSGAGVPWALVPSPAITRVLLLTGCDATLPAACSLPDAMRQVTGLTHARRQLAPITSTGELHAV